MIRLKDNEASLVAWVLARKNFDAYLSTDDWLRCDGPTAEKICAVLETAHRYKFEDGESIENTKRAATSAVKTIRAGVEKQRKAALENTPEKKDRKEGYSDGFCGMLPRSTSGHYWAGYESGTSDRLRANFALVTPEEVRLAQTC